MAWIHTAATNPSHLLAVETGEPPEEEKEEEPIKKSVEERKEK